jgi:hypothetical protein
MAARSCVYGNINGGVSRIGKKRPIVERNVGIGVAKDEGGNAATFEGLTQVARKCESYVFFGERGAKGLASIGSPVAGIDDGEITPR